MIKIYIYVSTRLYKRKTSDMTHTHLHPSYPPIPSILAIAKASSPENAPPDAAEEYRMAMRVCVSSGRYHFETSRIAPGKNPALQVQVGHCPRYAGVGGMKTHSKRPRRNRIATRPSKFCTTPVRVMIIPQARTRDPRYIEGRLKRFNIILLGTSAGYKPQSPSVGEIGHRTSKDIRDEKYG